MPYLVKLEPCQLCFVVGGTIYVKRLIFFMFLQNAELETMKTHKEKNVYRMFF